MEVVEKQWLFAKKLVKCLLVGLVDWFPWCGDCWMTGRFSLFEELNSFRGRLACEYGMMVGQTHDAFFIR